MEKMINKHIYSTCIYISLLVNVSVSSMVRGALPHMTEPKALPDCGCENTSCEPDI